MVEKQKDVVMTLNLGLFAEYLIVEESGGKAARPLASSLIQT